MKAAIHFAAGAMTLAAGTLASHANAQALDPADYVTAPDGTNLAIVYAQAAHASSLWRNGKKVDDNAGLDSQVAIFRYVHYAKVAGMTYDYQVLQPYVHLRGTGSSSGLGQANGFGDTILCATLWVHEDDKNRSYLGITPFVFIPSGNYTPGRTLNPGEDRWKGSMQLAYSQGVAPGTSLEASADVMLYGNRNSGPPSLHLSQDASFRFQGFARQAISKRDELAVRLMYLTGGRTRLGGLDQDDRTKTLSALLSWRHALDHKWVIQAQAGRDLSVENGFKEAGRIQLRLLKIF